MEVGSYSIPEMRLFPSPIEAVRIMYNKFEIKEVDYTTLASVLGHKSARSGSFTSKITVMKAYNLIDGRGKAHVTETGRKIADPANTEAVRNDGLIEAITSIPLWKGLFEKYTAIGKELPTSDFWLVLREICLVSPEEAQNKAETVRKAYLEDISKIEVSTKRGDSGMDTHNEPGDEQKLVTEMISFKDGGIELRLPKENLKVSWEKAKKMIDIYAGVEPQQLQSKSQKQNTKQEPTQ